jgi:hypothetical protein
MTRALDVVEDYLAWRAFPCLRMDGATAAAERGDLVARFNDPGAWAAGWLGGLWLGGLLCQAGRGSGATAEVSLMHYCQRAMQAPCPGAQFGTQPTAPLLPLPDVPQRGTPLCSC